MRADVVVRADTTACDPHGGSRSLVVIGGLPGAGKTTLLRRWLADRPPGVAGVDSEDVAARLAAVAPRLPYRVLRPLVHLVHRVRVLATVAGRAGVVVLTDPWTSPVWRAAVLGAARCAGRSTGAVLLDAPQHSAEEGQAARGRAVPARSMRRHAARWDRLLRRRHEASGPGRPRILLVDRAGARELALAAVLGRLRAPDPGCAVTRGA